MNSIFVPPRSMPMRSLFCGEFPDEVDMMNTILHTKIRRGAASRRNSPSHGQGHATEKNAQMERPSKPGSGISRATCRPADPSEVEAELHALRSSPTLA